MRIIFHSNAPFTNSAYGIQTALFVPRIAELGHEVIISAPHSFAGSPVECNGFRVIPAAGDPFGNDTITANYKYYGADLLITLCDVFKLVPSARELAGIPVAHWIPVDCEPVSETDLMVLRDGQGAVIAMSRFGQRMLRDEGLDPSYIPHGVDLSLFRPLEDRDGLRRQFGFDDGMFVIGICGMNRDPVRKALAEQVAAFARVHERHPRSRLMMHTAADADPGLRLTALTRRLGLTPDDVMFPDRYSYVAGLIDRASVAAWYGTLDILSCCSYGEGFGLPVLEAQACGVPVVATDCSALTELCHSGWLVEGEPFWVNGHGAWWRRPSVAAISDAYETAWQARENGDMPGLSQRAVAFAADYDADRVAAGYWGPFLKQLEAGEGGGDAVRDE